MMMMMMMMMMMIFPSTVTFSLNPDNVITLYLSLSFSLRYQASLKHLLQEPRMGFDTIGKSRSRLNASDLKEIISRSLVFSRVTNGCYNNAILRSLILTCVIMSHTYHNCPPPMYSCLPFRYRYINIIWFCCDWLAMSNSCYNPFIYGIYNVSNAILFLYCFPISYIMQLFSVLCWYGT
jgi:hypothetical protein